MADELGIELVYVPAENFWYLDDDEAFTPSLETPFMAEESVTRHILGVFKEREARVWLTGHGGDSLLNGSPLIYADRLGHGDLAVLSEIARYWKMLNVPLSRLWLANWVLFVEPLFIDSIKKNIQIIRKPAVPDWLDEGFERRTRIAERLNISNVPIRFRERARQANYSMAIYIDSIRMALKWAEFHGANFNMEVRHPFLDRRLAEFLMSIPPEQTFRAGWRKFILRKAMRGILPEVVRTRLDKTEFSQYIALGLRYKEAEKVRGLLNVPLQSRWNLVRLSKIQEIYERYVSEGRFLDSVKSWRFVCFELWIRLYQQLFDLE
jgi:asparagine synthase (glutamine-hydrolysing)